MKYVNAAEILPDKLLKELQGYIDGNYSTFRKRQAKKNGEVPAVHVCFIRREMKK